MNSIVRKNRSRWLLALLSLGVLMVAAMISWQAAVASSRRLADVRSELDEVRQMTGQIQRLKTAPRIASLALESPDEISVRVTSAFKEIAGKGVTLQRVDPQEPVRIGKSDYELRATGIELENVLLADLARFISALRRTGQGSEVRDIVLTEPRSARGSSETWQARLTLTQVIFSPKRR